MGCYHCYLNWSPVAVPGRQQPTLGNIDDVAGEGSSLSQCAVGIEGCVDDLTAPGNEPTCLVSKGDGEPPVDYRFRATVRMAECLLNVLRFLAQA